MPRAQSIFDLAQAIGAGDAKSVLERATKLVSAGLSTDTLVTSLADHLRNLLVIRTCGPDSELVEVPGVSMRELEAQAAKFDAIVLAQDIAILEELRRQLRASGAARALLDATLVRLALAEQFTSVDQLLAGVSGAGTSTPKKKDEVATPSPRNRGEGLGAIDRQSTDEAFKPLSPALSPEYRGEGLTPIANVEPIDTKDFAGVMSRLRDAIQRHAPGIDAFLSHGKLVAVESGNAVLRYSSSHETSVQMLSRNGKKEILQKELSDLLNEPVNVRFEIEPTSDDAPERAPAPAPRRASQARTVSAPTAPSIRITPELKEQLRSDPLVAAVMDELGGEIVKVE
jgi:DNA polymerase III gamma/tau subunit